MQLGKKIRLGRIMDGHSERTLIVPMDHGVSEGAVRGLVNARDAVGDMLAGGANAILMHKGLIRHCHSGHGDTGLIMHLSASTSLSPRGNTKVLVGSVEEAVRLGADGVSVHVNLGDPEEGAMLADMGRVAEACEKWGMPLLAMLYARGPQIPDGCAPGVVAHCARVGAELGADIVKVPYTGDADSFARVVAGCCVPVVIAGGPRTDTTRQFLALADSALRAGCSGLSVGRNVFQHPHRLQLMRARHGLVHRGLPLDEAVALAEA